MTAFTHKKRGLHINLCIPSAHTFSLLGGKVQEKNHLFLNSFLSIYQIFDNGRFPEASKKAAIEELLLQEAGKQFPRSYRASPELFRDIRALTVMENIKKNGKSIAK